MIKKIQLIFFFFIFSLSLNAQELNSFAPYKQFKENFNTKFLSSFIVNENGKSNYDEKKAKIAEESLLHFFKEENSEKIKINTTNLDYLKQKIKINSTLNNTAAVYRDIFNIASSLEKEKIKDLINTSKEKIEKGEIKFLKKYILNIKEINLNSIYANYSEKEVHSLLELKNGGEIISEMKKNYYKYKMNSFILNSFESIILDNLKNISSIFHFYKIKDLEQYIDNKHSFYKVNIYLTHYLSLTVGSFIIAFFSFLLIVLFRHIIFYIFLKRIGSFLENKSKLNIKNDNFQKSLIVHKYLKESFSYPLTIIIYTFAFQFALNITYPNETMQYHLFFDILYTIGTSLLFYKLIDNYLLYFTDDLMKRHPNIRKEMINMITNMAIIIIWMLAILFLLYRSGIDISGFLASLGVGGIAIALASKDSLSNIISAIGVIMDNSISQGDWIKLTSGEEGVIVDFGLRTTKIRTFQNSLIIIPNSKLAESSIENFSKRKIGRRIKMKIGLTYSSKKENIQKAIIDIKRMLIEHKGIANSNTPLNVDKDRLRRIVSRDDLKGYKRTLLVYLDEFNDSSIDILIYTFSRSVNWEDWLEVKQDVLFKIMDILKENSLELAFPSQSIYIEKK